MRVMRQKGVFSQDGYYITLTFSTKQNYLPGDFTLRTLTPQQKKNVMHSSNIFSFSIAVNCFVIRFQAHFLVDHRVRSNGMRCHLPLQQHHRLHERHRGDHRGHDDSSSLRGLLPFRGCVQHQPGLKTLIPICFFPPVVICYLSSSFSEIMSAFKDYWIDPRGEFDASLDLR